MSIGKKEKKYINKNFKKLSLEQLVAGTGIGKEELARYLEKRGKMDMVVSQGVEVKSKLQDSIKRILRENWKFLLAMTIGILILYANATNGDFVSDDYASISQNPTLKDWSFALPGLKIVNILTTLVAYIFGIYPLPYHLLSIVLFVMVCIVGFVFVYLMLGKNIAVISMILFALHPIHVESVSWISGKPYLVYSLFVLLGLIFWILYTRTGKNKYLLWVVVNMVLAFMGERPRSLSLLLVAILYLVYDWKNIKNRQAILKAMAVGGVLLLILLGIMWPQVMGRIANVNSGYNQSDSLFYDPLFQYPTGLTKYFQLMLVPIDLTLYHTMFTFPTWLNWLVFVVYIGSIVYFFFKDKVIFFCLLFVSLAIAPSMAPVKVSWLVAERYAFLGSLGFCMLVAYLLDKVSRYSKELVFGTVVIIGILFGVRTYMRNIDWQTNHKLWVNTVQVSPNSHNAWNNIGDDYDKLKQYDNAIKGFTQSTVVKTNYADAYHNRANIYFKTGYLAMARDSYETALKYSPGLYQTYLSLTQIDVMEKKMDKALEHATMAAKLQPDNYQSHFVLGWVLAQVGQKEQSINELKISLQLNPQFGPASEMLTQIRKM